MVMIEITKIENGLNFNGKDWFFSNQYLEKGYEIIDEIHISVELDNNIIWFVCNETLVGGEGPFNNSSDLINNLFKI